MKEKNCCLTLTCHRSLQERLIDHLLEHPEWVRGFSLTRIEGGSQDEKLHSMIEQVRGRSERVQIIVVMNHDDASQLIAHLKQHEANPDIVYWITPVIEFGRMA